MHIPAEKGTALNACNYRAHHYAHGTRRILDDPIANLLLAAAEEESIDNLMIERLKNLGPGLAASCIDRPEMLSWFMQASPSPVETLCRARYAGDELEDAVNQRVSQYVLIRAGMDTLLTGNVGRQFAGRGSNGLGQQGVSNEADLTSRRELSRRLGVAPEELQLVHALDSDFSDTALGCPDAGVGYGQVIVPGYELLYEPKLASVRRPGRNPCG